MSKQTRRCFLKVLAATAALPAAGTACSSNTGTGPLTFGDVSAGNVSSLPVGSLVAVRGASACVGRDANGVYAMTLTCTHAGCDMSSRGSVSSAGIVCDCHGSTFDPNGNPTGGPAPSPLAHFAVSVDASGNITVHGNQEVDASQRTKVG